MCNFNYKKLKFWIIIYRLKLIKPPKRRVFTSLFNNWIIIQQSQFKIRHKKLSNHHDWLNNKINLLTQIIFKSHTWPKNQLKILLFRINLISCLHFYIDNKVKKKYESWKKANESIKFVSLWSVIFKFPFLLLLL